jgi:hypothetical protein
MGGSDPDTTRTAVKTYVPAYQKDEWQRHADRLGMSQSEFVRTMVQAGRRGFDVPQRPDADGGGATRDDRANPEGGRDSTDLESRVLDALSAEEYQPWDALVTSLTDDIETRLDDALQSLQAAGEIQYSGRAGGYALREASNGE